MGNNIRNLMENEFELRFYFLFFLFKVFWGDNCVFLWLNFDVVENRLSDLSLS